MDRDDPWFETSIPHTMGLNRRSDPSDVAIAVMRLMRLEPRRLRGPAAEWFASIGWELACDSNRAEIEDLATRIVPKADSEVLRQFGVDSHQLRPTLIARCRLMLRNVPMVRNDSAGPVTVHDPDLIWADEDFSYTDHPAATWD